ncbi:hypothetical protein HCN44_008931 [Aphidius gifuensis]|uniref:Odorant-binding protein n=1 Tax=Aphidius gifuensis TaxID=684658 RepID=A0A834XQH8_APHGI|nr:hypothetical protein HCN44_008931 [Aphidius gifuensis]
MKAFCIIIVSFVLIFQGFNYVKCELELKLSHVLFRHVDKVPHKEFQNYPNDLHSNETYFPMGSGGLTNIIGTIVIDKTK